jgi:hypothetical protein
MKKFKIRKYYVNYLEGVFEANTPEEAEELFDATSEDSLTNGYEGNDSTRDIIEEV